MLRIWCQSYRDDYICEDALFHLHADDSRRRNIMIIDTGRWSCSILSRFYTIGGITMGTASDLFSSCHV